MSIITITKLFFFNIIVKLKKRHGLSDWYVRRSRFFSTRRLTGSHFEAFHISIKFSPVTMNNSANTPRSQCIHTHSVYIHWDRRMSGIYEKLTRPSVFFLHVGWWCLRFPTQTHTVVPERENLKILARVYLLYKKGRKKHHCWAKCIHEWSITALNIHSRLSAYQHTICEILLLQVPIYQLSCSLCHR